MSAKKITVLFFCEAVTLAHVARPATLAAALDRSLYDVHVAQHPRYRALLGDMDVQNHDLGSIEPRQFMQALAQGAPVYEESTLLDYVEEDKALIAKVQPDIIVGDFRISLQVSARLAGVPFVAITNAYWSEFCRQSYTVPDLPFSRLLGARVGQGIFSVVRPIAFALHCRPMNAVRKHYGLASAGHSLQRVYSEADYTLYADAAELFTMEDLPASHHFMGPVPWSPAYEKPDWWESVTSSNLPIVYVTLGSSGQADLLPKILDALAPLEANIMVSTAGAPFPPAVPQNVFLADYISGEEAVAVASLVVCNGGSPTTQQALANGVPVIGLAGNLDQFLNMAAITRSGSGVCLRGASASASDILGAAQRGLREPGLQQASKKVAQLLSGYDAARCFESVLKEAVPVNQQCERPQFVSMTSGSREAP